MNDLATPAPVAAGAPASIAAAPAGTPAPAQAPAGEAPDPLGRAQQSQQDGSAALPEWLGSLPDELKGDATLSRYQSIEELARGHVEAHKVAKSKVVLPKDGDAESFGRFAASIRPEKADDYQFNLPEGQDATLADAMKPIFHDAGLHPESAKRIVDGWNQYQAQQAQVAQQRGQDELAAVQAEMGQQAFAQGKQAAINMLNRLGIPSDFENDLSRFIGGGNTLRLLFNLSERMGELGRVDPTDIRISTGKLTGGDAQEEARRMMKDPAIAPKIADIGSPERKRYDELIRLSAQKG